MNKTINNLNVVLDGDKTKAPILFLHGFPYDHKMWDFQIDELKSRYFCIRYDIRGLGKSEAGNGQFTMESFVDDLSSLIDKLELDKPVLCSLSMGGYIALRAIERNPEIFKAVILCDTRAESDNNEGKLKRSAGIKKVDDEGAAGFAEGFVPACFAEESIKNKKPLYNSVLERAKQSNPVGLKGSLLAMLSRTDTTESLKKINVPVLVISGEHDKLTPPDVMKKMAENISKSEFHIVPAAGHMSPLENPDYVNKIIIDFLNRL